MSDALVIRDARPGDEDAILALLKDFAEFEKLTHTFRLTREVISRDFMGATRRVHCGVAELGGAIVGVMTWYRTSSTFQATQALFLEDLFVMPQFRGKGVAKALLKQLAHHAAKEGVTRIEWSVLDWNKVAIDFYAGVGARKISGWESYRLSGDALERLAKA